MWNSLVNLLLVCFAQAHAQELAANPTGDAQDSMNKLANELVKQVLVQELLKDEGINLNVVVS